jgi:hypothetical protein
MFLRTLCIAAFSAAMVVVASAPAAAMPPGPGNNDETEAMIEAWENYLKTVENVTKQLQASPSFQTDPTGLIDIQTGMIQSNLQNNMSSSGSGLRGMRPRWNPFDNPDVRIGIDNPDTRYLGVWIPNGDGQQIYRIRGNRSNSCDLITLTNDPTDPLGGGATLEDEDMLNTSGGPLGPNEDYEVFLSTAALHDPSWHNWMEIGASDELNISHRYTVCNYHTERPGDVSIERVDADGVAITAEEFRNPVTLTQGIERATAVMQNQQPFWGTFSQVIQNSGLPANVIAPWGQTGGLGITSQLSNLSWTDVGDGEALIIKVRTDYPGAYGSFMLFNAWGSSLPWGHHMANGSFEITGSAGNSYFIPSAIEEPIPPQIGGTGETARFTYIVVSKEDPGVHNWIGTMGHSPVFIAGRLQSVLDPADVAMVTGVGPWMPISFKVPLAAVFPGSPALPADMVFVTPAERSDQIRERQIYQKEKYAPW